MGEEDGAYDKEGARKKRHVYKSCAESYRESDVAHRNCDCLLLIKCTMQRRVFGVQQTIARILASQDFGSASRGLRPIKLRPSDPS